MALKGQEWLQKSPLVQFPACTLSCSRCCAAWSLRCLKWLLKILCHCNCLLLGTTEWSCVLDCPKRSKPKPKLSQPKSIHIKVSGVQHYDSSVCTTKWSPPKDQLLSITIQLTPFPHPTAFPCGDRWSVQNLPCLKNFLCFCELNKLKHNIDTFLKLLVHILQGVWGPRACISTQLPRRKYFTGRALPMVQVWHLSCTSTSNSELWGMRASPDNLGSTFLSFIFHNMKAQEDNNLICKKAPMEDLNVFAPQQAPTYFTYWKDE